MALNVCVCVCVFLGIGYYADCSHSHSIPSNGRIAVLPVPKQNEIDYAFPLTIPLIVASDATLDGQAAIWNEHGTYIFLYIQTCIQ